MKTVKVNSLNRANLNAVFWVWHKAGRFWAASGYWWEILDYIEMTGRKLTAKPGYEIRKEVKR